MTDLYCPACTAPGLVLGEAGKLRCEYCGTSFLGQPATCPSCGWDNPQGEEDCQNCGEPLSIVARVLTRQGSIGLPFWMRQLRSRVAGLKEQEALASEQRFEQLKDIDRRRMKADAEAHARQQAKDRQMMLVLGFGILVLLLVMLAVAITTFT